LSQISEYFGNVDDFEQRLQKVKGALADREKKEAYARLKRRIEARRSRLQIVERRESSLLAQKTSGDFCRLHGHKWTSLECKHENELFFCENNPDHRRGCAPCKSARVPVRELSRVPVPEAISRCRDCDKEFSQSDLKLVKSPNYVAGIVVCTSCNSAIEKDDLEEQIFIAKGVHLDAQEPMRQVA
jgi:hypothetical protein